MKILEDFQEKFEVNEYKIFETDFWVWSLRPHQATLGAGILSLKRECSTFSELSAKEYEDLSNIIKVIEPTLKESFEYDIMNYLMLMMVDKHVHYHVVPRYEKALEYNNETWVDTNWPGIPNLAGEALEKNKLGKITAYIKQNIKHK